MSRLVVEPSGRQFVRDLCERVFRVADAAAADELRRLLSEYGGVPTFFNSMGRLRMKAAAMAPRGMQSAALAEVRRVFRTTFGEIALPTHVGKVSRRAEALAKEGMQLMLHPLTPDVFGSKSAARYEKRLEAILTKQSGVGIVVQPQRLCPGLSPASPERSAEELAARLRSLIQGAMQGDEQRPVIIETHCSDTMSIIVAALKRTLDAPELDAAHVALELPGYLRSSVAYLRELAAWAELRARRGARPLGVLLTKGSHLEAERRIATLYGTSAQLCAGKYEADTCYIRLLNAAIDCSPLAIAPMVGTHELAHLCYAALRWARSGREGLPPLALTSGLGNHLGRQFARLGSPVMLVSGVASEETETRAFEDYLLDMVHELSRPGGFLSAGYAADAVDWSAKAKPLMAAQSAGRDDSPAAEPAVTACYAPGDLGSLLERANVDAFYEAARSEMERPQQPIDLQLGAEQHRSPLTFIHRSLTVPGLEDYRFVSADYTAVDKALRHAQTAVGALQYTEHERAKSLLRAARELDKRKAEFVALLVRDVGFTLRDALLELRDAADALRYAAAEDSAWAGMRDGATPEPLGVVVVAAGVAHPIADAVAGIASAWVAGNAIIYKPAAYATLVGTRLTALMNAAGVKLLCLPCVDNEISMRLMTDERVDALVCSATREQARLLASKAPACSVLATPAYGPSVYLAERCDWRAAVRELVPAAFRRSGQSASCPHIVLVHAKLYDDPAFAAALEDAVSSLCTQPAWLEGADMGPLSSPLGEAERKLLKSGGEGGERWLVVPGEAEPGSLLWRAGLCADPPPQGDFVRYGQRLPILGIVRVASLQAAMSIQRRLAQGGRAILFSQQPQEIDVWLQGMDGRWLAVNHFPAVRPGILPVLTWPTSLHGVSGPMLGCRNGIAALCHWSEHARPSLRSARRHLAFDPKDILPASSNAEETMRLSAAADSISYWWEQEFGVEQTLPSLCGERTTLTYHPVSVCLRIEKDTADANIAIALMAIMQAGCRVQLSAAAARPWLALFAEQYGVQLSIAKRAEYEAGFPELAVAGAVVRDPSADYETLKRAAACGLHIAAAPIIANARLEFLHYMQERLVTVFGD